MRKKNLRSIKINKLSDFLSSIMLIMQLIGRFQLAGNQLINMALNNPKSELL